jgi:hypothetical protein
MLLILDLITTLSMADWTEEEVDIILSDYFEMLIEELNGRPFNKTAHRRKILPLLEGRTEGSIEFKHQNISAALRKLDQPWIDGYKPAVNYQKTLLDPKVDDYLAKHPELLELFTKVAIKPVESPNLDFNSFVEDPPEPILDSNELEEGRTKYRRAVKLDYFEIERANRSLGDTGEELVMRYEKWRLQAAGKDSLSDRVEWVSREQGDGLGYDILSREMNGTDRYIEVKTTKQGRDTPIYFTRNEFEFSKEKLTQFFLYRVFDFRMTPKMFIVSGRYDRFCRISPLEYLGQWG